jgi:hypothetical protein
MSIILNNLNKALNIVMGNNLDVFGCCTGIGRKDDIDDKGHFDDYSDAIHVSKGDKLVKSV